MIHNQPEKTIEIHCTQFPHIVECCENINGLHIIFIANVRDTALLHRPQKAVILFTCLLVHGDQIWVQFGVEGFTAGGVVICVKWIGHHFDGKESIGLPRHCSLHGLKVT